MEEKKDIFNHGKEFIVDKLVGAFKKMKEQKAPAAAPKPLSEQVQANENTGTDAESFDYIAFQQSLFAAVFTKLRTIAANPNVYPNRYLNVYLADEGLLEWIENNAIAEKLNDYIEDRVNRMMAVNFHAGAVPAGTQAFIVMDGISISVTGKLPPPPPAPLKSALVSMCFDDVTCCILGGSVELSPEQGQVWNIGWGQSAEVKGRPRTNHIALEYKEPEKHNADEFLISRVHAHIRYTDKFYFLHVEERGTRQADKRTKIVRDGKEIELTDVKVGKALRNGDIIRLNNEYLLFTLKD